MKKVLLVIIIMLVLQPEGASSYNGHIVSKFTLTLVKKGEKEARKYVAPGVIIPEIREETPINGVAGLPSPTENVYVAVARFDDGEGEPERIAFIWEIQFEEDQVTDIQVVYDGSNPLKNELKKVAEYEEQYHVYVPPPAYFPIVLTHVHGNIKQGTLHLEYKNKRLDERVQVLVKGVSNKKGRQNGQGERIPLVNEEVAFYQKKDRRLSFHYRNLKYSLCSEDVSKDELIKMANSIISGKP